MKKNVEFFQDSNYITARRFGQKNIEKNDFKPDVRTQYMAQEFYNQILSIDIIEKKLENLKEKEAVIV